MSNKKLVIPIHDWTKWLKTDRVKTYVEFYKNSKPVVSPYPNSFIAGGTDPVTADYSLMERTCNKCGYIDVLAIGKESYSSYGRPECI